jgi:hypothetical protein
MRTSAAPVISPMAARGSLPGCARSLIFLQCRGRPHRKTQCLPLRKATGCLRRLTVAFGKSRHGSGRRKLVARGPSLRWWPPVAAAGFWGAPVASGLDRRRSKVSTPRPRLRSKQVPPRRSRSSMAQSDPERASAAQDRAALEVTPSHQVPYQNRSSNRSNVLCWASN